MCIPRLIKLDHTNHPAVVVDRWQSLPPYKLRLSSITISVLQRQGTLPTTWIFALSCRRLLWKLHDFCRRSLSSCLLSPAVGKAFLTGNLLKTDTQMVNKFSVVVTKSKEWMDFLYSSGFGPGFDSFYHASIYVYFPWSNCQSKEIDSGYVKEAFFRFEEQIMVS